MTIARRRRYSTTAHRGWVTSLRSARQDAQRPSSLPPNRRRRLGPGQRQRSESDHPRHGRPARRSHPLTRRPGSLARRRRRRPKAGAAVPPAPSQHGLHPAATRPRGRGSPDRSGRPGGPLISVCTACRILPRAAVEAHRNRAPARCVSSALACGQGSRRGADRWRGPAARIAVLVARRHPSRAAFMGCSPVPAGG